jgi:hypothetical protein
LIPIHSAGAERLAAATAHSAQAGSYETNVADSKSAMDFALAARQGLCFQRLMILFIRPIDLIFQTIINARQKNNELDHLMKNL